MRLRATAETFNHLIDRTIEELTMSDAEFNGIMSNLAERHSQMATGKASLTATHEAVRMIMEVSRDYLSATQACKLAGVFSPSDVGPGDTYVYWGSFGDWMMGLMCWKVERVHSLAIVSPTSLPRMSLDTWRTRGSTTVSTGTRRTRTSRPARTLPRH